MRRIWKRICRKNNVISAKNVGLPNFAQAGWLCQADCC